MAVNMDELNIFHDTFTNMKTFSFFFLTDKSCLRDNVAVLSATHIISSRAEIEHSRKIIKHLNLMVSFL